MASPSVIVSMNFALDDWDSLMSFYYPEFLFERPHIFKKQKFRVRSLKTFVLLARKFGNDVHLKYYENKNGDGSLESLLMKIEVAVSRHSEEIHSHFRWLEYKGTEHSRFYAVEIMASDLQRDFESLEEEIDEWYIATSDNTRQSNSLTADEVGEITESIWENLVDFRIFTEILAEPMEALREHVKFLTDFCHFATKRGVDDGQMKDFLTHTEAVAISAAHLCFLCGAKTDEEEFGSVTVDGEEWWKGLQFKISMLLQKIKPIDPRVCEIYTELISYSKLSRRLDAPTCIQEIDDDSKVVMDNFVDSLISILWEMLPLDICHVASLKDHWHLLYEGLRWLRTILKKLQPNDIGEQTRNDIGVAVCDAGVLVCSFYQENVEIHPGLQDLLERIKVFMAEVEGKVPQTSIFNSPRTNEVGFVDFLLEKLMELTNGKVEPIVQSCTKSIKEELLYLRLLLGEIGELRYEQDELRDLWNRVLEVAYRAEFLIDHLIVGDISDWFSMELVSVTADIKNIKTDASRSSYGKRQCIKVKEVNSTTSHVPSQKASITTEFVGFHDEAMLIMERLTRGSKQLRVIAIVGMGGLGKTTLAAKVYNDPAVMRYFDVRARCIVSQTLDKKTVLFELLNQIHPENYSRSTEDDLAEKLRRHLKGRRYLIFLDDIWTIEAWNSLRASFPDDFTGSRIILTSRNQDAAMLDQNPLYLRPLNKEESLELLQKKLFPGQVWPTALYNLGMQIAEKCKGLPLTIVIVGGLLETTEEEGWKKIVDGLGSGVVSSTEQ